MFDFCKVLESLKLKENILQKDIAKAIGISLRSYQRYEHGEREPTMSTLIALADFFNVSIDYLVGRTDKPDVNK